MREVMQLAIVTVNSCSNWIRGGSGGRRGAARSCWQVEELCAVRGAETSSGCCLTGDPHLRLDWSSADLHRLKIFTFFPPRFLKEYKKISVLLFSNRCLDLKMALHGLTLRKAKADLFDCCFVTVKPALSDWTCSLSFSIFWLIFLGHRGVFCLKTRSALFGLIS